MKKILLIVISLFVFSSCLKEEKPEVKCNHGKVVNKGKELPEYWLEVRNNCSGNETYFYVDSFIWSNINVGEEFCISTTW